MHPFMTVITFYPHCSQFISSSKLPKQTKYIVSHNEWTFLQSLQFFMMSLKWIVSFEVLLEMVLLYLLFFLLFFCVAFSFSALSFLLLNSVGATPLKVRLMESADGKLYDKELKFFF